MAALVLSIHIQPFLMILYLVLIPVTLLFIYLFIIINFFFPGLPLYLPGNLAATFRRLSGMSFRVSKSHGSSSKGKSAKLREKSKKWSKDKVESSIELYYAICTAHFGNYYHWAFAARSQQTRQWCIFEVVQDEQDGLFRHEQRQVDPRNSNRCQRPLTLLGCMHPG